MDALMRGFGVALVALAACSRAAPMPGDTHVTPPETPSEIERRLFSPEAILEHQSALGLSAAQHEAIAAEMKRAQSELQHTQWAYGAEKEKLATLLDVPHADEAAVVAQAQKVVALEDAIKMANLTMLVHIKNQLDARQQKLLEGFAAR